MLPSWWCYSTGWFLAAWQTSSEVIDYKMDTVWLYVCFM